MRGETVNLRKGRRVLAALLAAGTAVLPIGASAQHICLKPAPANIVPGLGGPPDWGALGRTELNEPRWGAAPLTRFSNDPLEQMVSEGGIRVILSADQKQLYVSVQNKADAQKLADSSVSFGVFQAGGTPRAVTFPLLRSSVNALGNQMPTFYTASDPLVHTFQRVAADDPSWVGAPVHHIWSSALGMPSWISSAASWTTHAVENGGADWAIQFRVNLGALGIDPGETFKFAIGMRARKPQPANERYLAEVGIPAQGTRNGWDYVDQASLVGDFNAWRDYTLGSPCAEGIKASAIDITNTLANGKVDARPNQTNTFQVDLARDSGSITSSTVQASFKIANWGADIGSASAEWDTLVRQTIAVPGAVPARNKLPINTSTADGYAGSSNTRITYPCVANTPKVGDPTKSQTVCGAPAPTGDYQCIMAELAQAPGAGSTVISSPVTFKNFRFEGLSEKKLGAQLSIRGLAALTGRAIARDVIVDVITRNMPTHGNLPIFLDSWLMNQLKSALLGLIQLVNPFGLSLSAMDQMKVAWPTYETHTYYEAGHTVKYRGNSYKIVRPMNGFGYFFSHEGLLFGYNHQLRGVEQGLTPIAGNGRNQSYFVRMASESKINLNTFMIAEEIPAFLTNPSNRICEVFDVGCPQ